MKIENIKAYGFEGAMRGMRNPKNSWHLSDSKFGIINLEQLNDIIYDYIDIYKEAEFYNLAEDANDEDYFNYVMNNFYANSDSEEHIVYNAIGPKDLKLAQNLITSGNEHRKFLRQIFVSMDITAPLYVWKELDTYKVATVANSTSTMHKLTSKPITLDCFEIDDYDGDLYVPRSIQPEENDEYEDHWHVDLFADRLIYQLEELRQAILKEEDPKLKQKLWKELVRWLPEGWLQTRTWTANYETLRSIYNQRRNHKLTEWHTFCDTLLTLPYANEFIAYGITI